MRRTEAYLVYRARNAARLAPFEDRRMWRLLLARLHPDAGGDHHVVAFACAVRDEVSGGVRVAGKNRAGDAAPRAGGSVGPLLPPGRKGAGPLSSTHHPAPP